MPKIIDNVEEAILKEAIYSIQEDYEHFSIRNIAKVCNIGIGTVYNYFPSKEALLEAAISFFVNMQLSLLQNKLSKVHTKKEKCFIIYENVKKHGESFCPKFHEKLNILLLSSNSEIEIAANRIEKILQCFFDLVKKEFNIEKDITVKMVTVLLFASYERRFSFEDVWETMTNLLHERKGG